MSNKRTQWKAPVGGLDDAPRFGSSRGSDNQFTGWVDLLTRPLALFLLSVILLLATVTVKFWREGRFDHWFSASSAAHGPNNNWMLGGSKRTSHVEARPAASSDWVSVEETELASAVDEAQAAASRAEEAEASAAE